MNLRTVALIFQFIVKKPAIKLQFVSNIGTVETNIRCTCNFEPILSLIKSVTIKIIRN